MGYRAGEDLPANGGCGVLGSQIVFISSPGPFGPPYGPGSSKQVYAFDTKDPKHPEIVNMDATVHEGNMNRWWLRWAANSTLCPVSPLVEVSIHLRYLIPNRGVDRFYLNFQGLGTGSLMQLRAPSCLSPFKTTQSSALTSPPTQANKNGRVPSMCRGGPFPFQGKALVLDLPHHNQKKLMFTAMNYEDYGRRRRLLVYLMSLYENRETITWVCQSSLLVNQRTIISSI